MPKDPPQKAPAIVQYGACFIKNYFSRDFRHSLFRAFAEKHADFIALDDHLCGQRFRAACVAWGIREGLLYNDQTVRGSQEELSTFRLTPKGRAEILGQ
ncbi:MAG: hypothetical protein KGJ13_03735 [Patescibacteria group bacterium]|nr:hypothetical protein [Patescibacteria group bacterium]